MRHSAMPPNSSLRSPRLRAGLHDVVKASIAGSIVGNILLVLGAAMLAGGLRHPEQHFNAAGARSQATMLTLAAIALIAAGRLSGRGGYHCARVSAGSACRSPSSCFSSICCISFSHWSPIPRSSPVPVPGREGKTATRRSAGPRWCLAAATAAIAWMSEIMVGAIEPTAHEFGLSNVFVGVFVVAILGNAAEHATAISAAMKDRMDLSLSIAIGSSVQVALFVAPVLVFASLFLGPAPMDLAFPAGLVLIVLLSALITAQVAGDGRSDWLKGVQLLAVYLVLGLAFFFLPSA